MAKKAAKKKRKSETAMHTRAATKEAPEGQTLGWISIQVPCNVYVGDNVTTFNETVIEWACLGLAEEPDRITETSGNASLLHPDWPPVTSAEGLHVFFKPNMQHGTYGFVFNFTYLDSVQARTADPAAVKLLYEPEVPPAEAA